MKGNDMGLNIPMLCHHSHLTFLYSQESILTPHDQWGGYFSPIPITESYSGNHSNILMVRMDLNVFLKSIIVLFPVALRNGD